MSPVFISDDVDMGMVGKALVETTSACLLPVRHNKGKVKK